MPLNDLIVVALPVAATIFMLVRHRGELSLTRPTLFTVVFVVDYLVLFSLGAIYYSTSPTDDRYVLHSQLTSDDSIAIASLSAFFFIIVFSEIWRIILPRLSAWLALATADVGDRNANISPLAPTIFFSILVIVLFLVISLEQRVGIFSYMWTDQASLVMARTRFTLGGGAEQFLRIISFYWIPMLSYMWLFLLIKATGYQRFLCILFFAIFIIIGVLASISGFEKSRLAFFLIGLIGIWIYAGGRVNIAVWIVAALASLILVALGYLIYGSAASLPYLAQAIVHRTSTQAVGAILAFDWYPKIMPFKGLAGLSSFLADLLHQHFSTPYADIIDRWDPANAATSGSMASFATGEAYGLFGWFGVLISPVVAALYFGALEATKRAKAIQPICASAYGLFFGMPFLATGFYSFFWPVGFVYAFGPFVLIGLVATFAKGKSS